MKDSEKDKRISNLKNILDSVKRNNERKDNEFYDTEDKEMLSNDELYDEYEGFHIEKEDEFDKNLITDLDEKEEIEEDMIDDEFIYTPSTDSNPEILKEDDSAIDEDFIISTKNNSSNDGFPEIDFSKDEEISSKAIENKYKDDKINIKSSENKFKTNKSSKTSIEENDEFFESKFDKFSNIKIGNIYLMGILGIVIGFILILISTFLAFGSSDRVIDNVTSGEANVIAIILLFIGIIILIFSIFKGFSLNNPFGDLAKSIDKLEKNHSDKDKTTSKEKKNNIPPEPPIDREKYKIGEFDLKTLELTKPIKKIETDKLEKKSKEEKYEFEDKSFNNTDTKSIDDIFSDLDDFETIDDSIDIISVDEKIEKNFSKDKK